MARRQAARAAELARLEGELRLLRDRFEVIHYLTGIEVPQRRG
jgi:hypothetical protein